MKALIEQEYFVYCKKKKRNPSTNCPQDAEGGLISVYLIKYISNAVSCQLRAKEGAGTLPGSIFRKNADFSVQRDEKASFGPPAFEKIAIREGRRRRRAPAPRQKTAAPAGKTLWGLDKHVYTVYIVHIQ